MVTDVVCNMPIKIKDSTPNIEVSNQKYYFCSTECKNIFGANSEKFARKKGIVSKFLEWLAKENKKQFGNSTLKCH